MLLITFCCCCWVAGVVWLEAAGCLLLFCCYCFLLLLGCWCCFAAGWLLLLAAAAAAACPRKPTHLLPAVAAAGCCCKMFMALHDLECEFRRHATDYCNILLFGVYAGVIFFCPALGQDAHSFDPDATGFHQGGATQPGQPSGCGPKPGGPG